MKWCHLCFYWWIICVFLFLAKNQRLLILLAEDLSAWLKVYHFIAFTETAFYIIDFSLLPFGFLFDWFQLWYKVFFHVSSCLTWKQNSLIWDVLFWFRCFVLYIFPKYYLSIFSYIFILPYSFTTEYILISFGSFFNQWVV